MTMTVEEIARRLGGRVAGDGASEISGVAGLEEARPGQVSFLWNPRYARALQNTRASAVVADEQTPAPAGVTLIRVKDPEAAFAEVAGWFAPPPVSFMPGIHPTAIVSPEAVLGEGVHVGPYCVVEAGASIGARTVLVAFCYIGHGVVLGPDGLLYPHVSVRERCQIGARVIIHNGVVIGSDGFGYRRRAGRWLKIPQTGIVVIEDDVEIGANTTVDRARFGETRIGRGAKVDNLVQIAHNVVIGPDTAIAAQVGIAGSSHVGARVQLGGQAGIAGHLHVGENAVVGAQSGVTKDVAPGTYVVGFPAMPQREAFESHAHVKRLPELKERLATLEKRVRELEEPE